MVGFQATRWEHGVEPTQHGGSECGAGLWAFERVVLAAGEVVEAGALDRVGVQRPR